MLYIHPQNSPEILPSQEWDEQMHNPRDTAFGQG